VHPSSTFQRPIDLPTLPNLSYGKKIYRWQSEKEGNLKRFMYLTLGFDIEARPTEAFFDFKDY
jgi:hypothetical protein